MPTLLSVLALVALAALAPPSGVDSTVPDPREEHRQWDADSVSMSEEARLDLAALTADWPDGP